MARYRGTAIFVTDWRALARPLDRNQKARVLLLAESLERRTKGIGRRNGVVSLIGLQVLRVLLMRFLNSRTGLLCPSYTALQLATGFCRGSIANALARLERCGILRITRRLVRARVTRISPITGVDEQIVTTVQTSSLYSCHEPGRWADHLSRPPARPSPFPVKRQLDLLQAMSLTWKSRLSLEQSPRGRGKPPSKGPNSVESILRAQ